MGVGRRRTFVAAGLVFACTVVALPPLAVMATQATAPPAPAGPGRTAGGSPPARPASRATLPAFPTTPVADVPADAYAGLRWRLIGPFRGGRVLTVTGVRGRRDLYYFGAVGGGVWKTVNGGHTWQPLTDALPLQSIGALAVAPSNPDVIYVGTGEAAIRSDISFGDGVYKSTDGGATWRHVGLRDTRHIARVLVDPRNPDIVLVAALGHAYGRNPERGVFRSTDGGTTWTKVLFRDDATGAVELAADPDNFSTVFAALWNGRRVPWSTYAPVTGPGGGLFRSTDAGATWHPVSGGGLPQGDLGRSGLAVAAGTQGRRVYALIDAPDHPGLYRSDDGGATWALVNSDTRIRSRPWYFMGLTVDPRNPDVVYASNVALHRSTDGGRTFESIRGAPGGDDYHDLWIDPDDPKRMISGADQGTIVSVDGGDTWTDWYNQPTGQFYQVAIDTAFPYRVYGAQQDSGTVGITSRGDYGQITYRDWMPMGAGESGYVVPDPVDPDLVWGGSTGGELFRFSRRTGQVRDVTPWPALAFGADVSQQKYRFPWTTALAFSPFTPRAIYQGAQVVLQTLDGGASWTAISPDLTKNGARASTLPDDLRARADSSGIITTIRPSPVAPGEVWVGTDTGLVQLTRDGGRTWRDVTPPDLTAWSAVSLIDASPFDAGTAFIAVDRHRIDDFAPYLYRTSDYGRTWTRITNGLPAGSYAWVVREDGKRRGLLFAGTETGVFVSLDAGDHWHALQLNLPRASIRDLAIGETDVVVATHGRAFWILDDITPLRRLTARTLEDPVSVAAPAVAWRVRASENRDTPLPKETPVGTNPPAGAVIDYWLKGPSPGEVTLDVLDGTGAVVRHFSSADPTSDTRDRRGDRPDFPRFWLNPPPPLPARAGHNRFVWDLRYPKPKALRYGFGMAAPIGGDAPGEPEGALVLPGTYQLRLTAGATTVSAPLVVRQDPRVPVSDAHLRAQLALLREIDRAMGRSCDAVIAARDVARQLHALRERTASTAGGDLAERLDALESRVTAIDSPRGLAGLNGQLGELSTIVSSADAAPTQQARELVASTTRAIDTQLAAWESLQTTDLALVNERLAAQGSPALAVPKR